MKNQENDILARAVESIKSECAAGGPAPPKALVDATIERLAEASQGPAPAGGKRIRLLDRIGTSDNILRLTAKVAAAAAVLVLCGFGVGRLTVPARPDVEQLRASLEHSLMASLEPAIRQQLLAETDRRLELALAQTSTQIIDGLTQEYRSDLNQFAVQTLATSNLLTNHLLSRLVESIEAAQTQDRKSIATALYEIERNRLQDKSELATGLEALAYQTEDQLQQTRQDMVRLLVKTEPEDRRQKTEKESQNFQ